MDGLTFNTIHLAAGEIIADLSCTTNTLADRAVAAVNAFQPAWIAVFCAPLKECGFCNPGLVSLLSNACAFVTQIQEKRYLCFRELARLHGALLRQGIKPMPKKRFRDEQVAFALRQTEAGTTISEVWTCSEILRLF